MFTAGRWSQLRKPLVWGPALCFLLLGMVFYLWSADSVDEQQPADMSVVLTLPPRPAVDPAPAVDTEPAAETAETKDPAQTTDPAQNREATASAPAVQFAPARDELANPAFTEPALDPLKPGEPNLDLVDASPFGPLPRIADDGRSPLQTYARPYGSGNDNPKVAILVTGLGQQADATDASFHLPGAVSLMFSPYSDDLPAHFERARLAGHEVLIELPMEPEDYPANDPGPHTLRASGTVNTNMERLNWILARAPGYVAVGGKGGVFAGSAEAEAVMDALANRGVGMIETDGNALADWSRETDLAYLTADDRIDETPSAEAIDRALADLEEKARQSGSALGVAEAYPVTLQRLADWAAGLEARGVTLVPASALLLEETGSNSIDDQASNFAQSRN